MRGRGIIILLVVFLALAGLLYLQDSGVIGEDEPPTSTPALSRVFPQLAVSDIIALQLQAGESLTLTIARDNQGNWVAPELDAPLNQTLVQQLAASFALMPFSRTIEETDNLEQFGFRQPPAFMISALTLDAQYGIIIGDFLQNGTEYYALVDERPGVYIVQRGAIDFIAGFLTDPPLANDEQTTP